VKRANEFQLRVENAQYYVYMTRVKGQDVPRAQQRAVYAWPNQAKAQTVCDALNNGALSRILLAMNAVSP
jgi:hypothetical protein